MGRIIAVVPVTAVSVVTAMAVMVPVAIMVPVITVAAVISVVWITTAVIKRGPPPIRPITVRCPTIARVIIRVVQVRG